MIRIRNLRASAGAVTLVDVESLDIDSRSRVGMVGESGSGKTLTAMSIVGLQPRELSVSGSITLNDEDLLAVPEKRLAQIRGKEIGVIFQDPDKALDPVMRVGRQIAEAVRHGSRLSRHEVDRRVLDLLREVQLPDPAGTARRYPHQLSGGQKQRVMIAIAIAQNPQMLIADEATTALDVTVQQRILDLVLKVCANHQMGLLWISHDIGVVNAVCDKVVVMYSGKIVETGPTDEIIQRPKHEYTRRLLAANLDRAFQSPSSPSPANNSVVPSPNSATRSTDAIPSTGRSNASD
jgi:peptide/nickel transport system ATP-binding protein